jgi:hypothetical protein
VPGPEASRSWLDRFTAAFPGAQHVALGFDRMHGTIAELDWFARQGFTVEAQAVMTASKVHQPARRNTDAVYRRLHSDADWAYSVTLRLRCNEGTYEPRGYHRYVAARVQTHRGLVEAGHGGWFGAFIDGRLVSQMGLSWYVRIFPLPCCWVHSDPNAASGRTPTSPLLIAPR